ncbi:hypothetical protein KJK32_46275 (plasmid) [Streptomyces sp. JCM17656]|nr:hypothetical protein KJK32_46275 [Streptomyces sp. JCM17656]
MKLVKTAGAAAAAVLVLGIGATTAYAHDGTATAYAQAGNATAYAQGHTATAYAQDGSGPGYAHDGSGPGYAHDGSGPGYAHDGSGPGYAHDGSGPGYAHDGSGRKGAGDGCYIYIAGNDNTAACNDVVQGNNNTAGTGHTVSTGLTSVAPATSGFTLTTNLSGLTVNTDSALTNGAFANALGSAMTPGQLTAPQAPQSGMNPVPVQYRVLDGQSAQLTLNRNGSPTSRCTSMPQTGRW